MMTYILKIIFSVSIIHVFLNIFLLSVLSNLLKHVKRIVKCDRLFENVM